MLKIKKLKNKIIDKNASIILGVLIVVIGIFSLSYNYLLEKRNRAFDLMNIALIDSQMPMDITGTTDGEITNDVIETETNKKPNSNDSTNNNGSNNNSNNNKSGNKDTSAKYDYIGYLEVPRVNLKKGFLDPKSKYNSIDYNVTIVKTSVFPNVDKGNFILAAHSGTATISYFRNLYQLEKGDTANVYYKKNKYTYKLVKHYNVPKNGKLSIYRDYNKTTLTLITCTKDNKKSQTIYIFELSKITDY